MKLNTPGERIRWARERAELSLREAAKAIGMGKSSLADIENGESELPSSRVLFKMADVLKVSPKWIVDGEDGNLYVASAKEADLLTTFRNLPEQSQQTVLAMISALKTPPKS